MDGEGRRYARAEADQEVRITFRLAGQTFSELQVSTLGVGGCSLTASAALAAKAREAHDLDDVRFECASLPSIPFRARVAWIAGHNPVCMGLAFQDVPASMGDALADRVHALRSASTGQGGY